MNATGPARRPTGSILLGCLLCLLGWPQANAAEVTASSSRWENDMREFEAADRTNLPPRHAILFIGSSSIRLWKTLAQDFPAHRVINRGFGGSEISDSVHFADRIVIPYAPRLIVMYAGGNDINGGKTPEQCHFAGENQPPICGSKSPIPRGMSSYQIGQCLQVV